jgi:hypothetical protein
VLISASEESVASIFRERMYLTAYLISVTELSKISQNYFTIICMEIKDDFQYE